MNIVGVQLIVAAFGFLMLYNLFLHWKKKNIGIKAFMAWFLMWGGLLFINFFPKLIEPFIKELFFIRIFDFATVGALIVLTYVMFENHIRINKMQIQIEKLVQKIAISKRRKNAKR
jgi:hypothetical protein